MSSVKKSTTSQNKFHYPALRKMEQLEQTLVPVPSCIPRLSELLNIPETQCVYCQCDWPSWNNKNVEGDEVYPCTLPQKDGPSTINGRYNKWNKYTCCTNCNSSKGKKIDDEFETWVDTGGNAQDGARRIPIPVRQRIIDWYKMSKYWITTDDLHVISVMVNLQDVIKTRTKSPPRSVSCPRSEKTFVSNREVISLFAKHPYKTNKELSDYLGIGSSNISQWKNYETRSTPYEVPPKHLPKIREFFKK
jgi:hypothetical protein